jgi:hypothetical protein
MRPFDPVSVPFNIDCREPAYVHGTKPAIKALGSIPFGLYRPQIVRSKALHASKFKSDVLEILSL